MDAVPLGRPKLRRNKNIIVEEHLDAVAWPQECAACGKPVEQTDTLALKNKFKNLGEVSVNVAGIPYCQDCYRKISAGKRLNQIVLIVAIVIAVPLAVFMILAALRDQNVTFIWCGLILFLAFLLGYGLAWLFIKLPAKTFLRKRITEPVDAWLISEKKADGKEGISVVISIPNKRYADKFFALNSAPPPGGAL